ncbi:PREDICTED: uncharacterized protein LOC109152820 [Ipomoea nil]|uniref:uncharacterized protein LOC109152820 n=1 Tax=Ipomoea nil TaxID=35883 RepID=UPI0009013621|nr:PREDICTED: uncharacterized protein LOC109152820 [Ipomoea nil]
MDDGFVNSSERTFSNIPLSSATSVVNSLSTARHFIHIKLTDNNYLFWRAHVVLFLNDHDLLRFVDGTNPCPPATLSVNGDDTAVVQPNLTHHAWIRQDQALLSILMASFSDEVMPLAIGHRTSRAVWTAVVGALASSSRSRGLNLLDQLQTLNQGNMSVTDYIGKARLFIEELTLVGRPMTLEEQNLYVLRGLRPEFRGLASSLNVHGQLVTLQELADLLGAEEFMMHGGPRCGSPTAFTMQRRGQKGCGSSCNNGGRGSSQNNGQTSHPRDGGGGRGRGGGRNGIWQPKCQLFHVLGHTTITCHLRYAKDPQVNIVYQESPSDPQGSHSWFPYAGATNHTTPNIAVFSFSEEYNGNDTLRVGDGMGI